MATTKLWHISGNLRDVIDYAENPEKTCPIPDLEDLANAARYVQRPEATADGQFVTGINCLAETAVQQMQLTKEQYHKTGGYIAWHGYQSFKPGEVTPEECHQIGVETAQRLWGDRFQVLVTTHLDRHHLHNHFILNSVSFVDGKKYNYSRTRRRPVRYTSMRRTAGPRAITSIARTFSRRFTPVSPSARRRRISAVWDTSRISRASCIFASGFRSTSILRGLIR